MPEESAHLEEVAQAPPASEKKESAATAMQLMQQQLDEMKAKMTELQKASTQPAAAMAAAFVNSTDRIDYARLQRVPSTQLHSAHRRPHRARTHTPTRRKRIHTHTTCTHTHTLTHTHTYTHTHTRAIALTHALSLLPTHAHTHLHTRYLFDWTFLVKWEASTSAHGSVKGKLEVRLHHKTRNLHL